METMTKGRIYVTVDDRNNVKYINYYDKNNKRFKQIDLSGKSHKVNGKNVLPHTHKGCIHDENGTFKPSIKELKMIERITRIWDNKNK